MKRRSFLRSSATLVGIGMLGSGDSHADSTHPHSAHASSLMTECAERFLSALDAGQRGRATFPFDTDERMNWHFIPKERKGMPLRELIARRDCMRRIAIGNGLTARTKPQAPRPLDCAIY